MLGAATFGRVVVLIVVATLVRVPVGVWIGMNPRVARLTQPIVQMLANFLFPFATLAFIELGVGRNIGGILPMALGAQSQRDRRRVGDPLGRPRSDEVLGVTGRQRRKRLIIPGVLTAYVTGGITAAGGAWNASIVAEVVTYHPTRQVDIIMPLSPTARSGRRTIVSVSDLTKTFATRDGGELPVLEDLNLEVQPWEIVAPLGKSGSGRSTGRCIAGLVSPSSGSIAYRSKSLQGINRGVSLVFQTFALLPWLSVQQNVELGLEAQGIPPNERALRALEAIDLIGLDGFESAFHKELSGGMRQRVGFARALVVEPDLLLTDEPFSALDVLTAENLRTELLELWPAGEFPAQAILIVTRNIEKAVTFADRVIVLGTNPGRIRAGLACTLARPRDRRDEQVNELVDRIDGIMTDRPAPAASADEDHEGGGAQHVGLPHASVDGIAELALVNGEDGELADLAAVVGFEINDLFPLVDALTILGFATVAHGRLNLTDTGKQFAGADIQQSKAIFRDAALQRVALVRRIRRARAPERRRPARGVLHRPSRQPLQPRRGRRTARHGDRLGTLRGPVQVRRRSRRDQAARARRTAGGALARARQPRGGTRMLRSWSFVARSETSALPRCSGRRWPAGNVRRAAGA